MASFFSPKNCLQKILILFAVSFAAYTASAQRLDTLLMMYNARYPAERVHLQFDKSSYAPQDDVWFKAYIMTGITPDTLSKSLYIDFSDEKGKVWAHEVYPITQFGTSFGQFKIPDSLQGNLIHVRAYTKWMLNFDSAFTFNKNLTLIQPKIKRIKGKPPVPEPKLYFFPEGGDAVAGLKSRIAFMCEDQYGQPVSVSGSVKDNSGKEVTTFKAEHDGMGSFYLLPDNSQKYTATWKDDKGNQHTTALPDVKNVGIALSVSPSAMQDVFEISRQENAADNFKNLHVVATMYQQVVYMANISLNDKTTVSGAIPVANFPSGILQVTVFDNSWNPLAERITAIRSGEDIFHPEVGFTKLNFDTRGQNELVVNVPDSVPADMSVSVTDATLNADSSNNLLSTMFLASQVRGNIYKPYYYLDTAAQVISDLDLVMLTHGWRRFDWKNVIGRQPLSLKYPMDSSYLSFAGKIYGASAIELAQTGMMLAIIQPKGDTTRQMQMVNLNADGTFNNPDAIYFDSLNVYYKFAGKHDYLRNAKVDFIPDRLVSPGKIPMDENDIVRARTYDTTGLAAGQSLYDKYWAASHFNDTAGTLADVKVEARVKSKEEKLDDEYTSGLFKGGQARVFDIEDDPTAQGQMNILAYLQGRVAGLQISNPMSPTPTLTRRGSTPSLFLDEVQQQDASMLTNLSMSDIAMVKVFDPPFMGAFGGGAGGAIAVYTKRGSDAARNDDDRPKIPHKQIIQYTAIRQFYIPNYLSLAETHDKQDVRQTLYWNPYIITTPQKHEVRLPFFNNDITHSFRVILEGVNSNGQLVHIEKVYSNN